LGICADDAGRRERDDPEDDYEGTHGGSYQSSAISRKSPD
jgi:hypothetical protein